jgi:hypothetical protein
MYITSHIYPCFFCSVLTPYLTEDVLFSISDLDKLNEEDGVSILFYLQKIFPGSSSSSLLNNLLALLINFGCQT